MIPKPNPDLSCQPRSCKCTPSPIPELKTLSPYVHFSFPRPPPLLRAIPKLPFDLTSPLLARRNTPSRVGCGVATQGKRALLYKRRTKNGQLYLNSRSSSSIIILELISNHKAGNQGAKLSLRPNFLSAPPSCFNL